MGSQTCPNCKREIAAGSNRCDHCRTALESTTASSSGYQPALLIRISRWTKIAFFLIIASLVGIRILGSSVFETHSVEPLQLIFLFLGLCIPLFLLTGFLINVIVLLSDKISLDRIVARNNLLLLLAILLIGTGAAIILPAQTSNGGPRRICCVNNLRQLGLIMALYAFENQGDLPPIDDTRNNFMFEGSAVFPDYLTDAKIVACPSDPQYDPKNDFRLISTAAHPDSSVGLVHPDCITDMNYCYLGWLVTNDKEAEAFFEAYDKMSPEDYDKDIIVPEGMGNGGGNVLHRLIGESVDVGLDCKHLSEIVKIYSNKDISQIPVMWDKPSLDLSKISHHDPKLGGGGNVLYLDGHVEFVEYPKKFPMTETLARLLDERPREPIPDCDSSARGEER